MSLFLAAIRNPQSETAGSAIWQIAFLSFAVVLLLFEVVRGWRLGLLRQVTRGAAVIAAYAAAYFGGDLMLPLLRPILKWPDFLTSMLAGALLAVVVYGLIAGLGSILFKRTAQQSSRTVRLAFGVTGALAGFCFGAFFIWMILVGIRSIGSVAEAQVAAHPRAGPEPNSPRRSMRPSRQEDVPPTLAQFDADSVTAFMARLKNSVELGAVGDAVKKTDLTPASVYQTLHDVGTICANPESAQRFLSFPGAVELSQHPKIVALRNDPEIAVLISEGRILELLQHPRILAAANDPTLVARVKQFDLRKALEFAAKKE
jgi:hypothetical protein